MLVCQFFYNGYICFSCFAGGIHLSHVSIFAEGTPRTLQGGQFSDECCLILYVATYPHSPSNVQFVDVINPNHPSHLRRLL